jgi:hypothetical protein
MSLTELIVGCDGCLKWLHGDELKGLAWVFLTGYSDQGARQRIREWLVLLLAAGMEAGGDPPVTEEEVLRATSTRVPKPLGVTKAIRLVRRLRAWAVASGRPETEATEQPARPRDAASAPQPEATSKVSLDAQALAFFIEHPDWTKKRIAEHLVRPQA